ncbi:hypothetical protein REC12_15700 [Desulfosporosinus sp. PR]|uniref:hypothetical protein n=1 Tax=Candidatus Desulfosporosinus nitrosoreducens TaxID=3401928 RepID=UPI0027EC1726|nr:hypothetical protein [Desulfosporosinus sp. PR]MDQ7095040.1 hypothetical protein [Desulfosporosinus sp. PR]
MASLIGQRGHFPTQQTIFSSPGQQQNFSSKQWQGLSPVRSKAPTPATPANVQPEIIIPQKVTAPFSSVLPQKSRVEQKALPSPSETTSLWQQQAGALLKQYGPAFMRQFGPPLARKIGFPLAQHFGPPIARKVGAPLARKLFVPLAKRAGFALIKRLGFPFWF